jgi:hypothetical protein
MAEIPAGEWRRRLAGKFGNELCGTGNRGMRALPRELNPGG